MISSYMAPAQTQELRSYQEIVTDSAEKRTQADGCDWGLGDNAEELTQLVGVCKTRVQDAKDSGSEPDPDDLKVVVLGKKAVKRLAEDIGVSYDYMEHRRRVSARITPYGSLAWIRDSSLSFTHCRALYPIKDDTVLEMMANKALSQKMTVEDLRAEVAVYKDTAAVEEGGYTCSVHGGPIEDAEKMYSVRQGRKTSLICSSDCLKRFAELALEAEGAPVMTETKEDIYVSEDAPDLLASLM